HNVTKRDAHPLTILAVIAISYHGRDAQWKEQSILVVPLDPGNIQGVVRLGLFMLVSVLALFLIRQSGFLLQEFLPISNRKPGTKWICVMYDFCQAHGLPVS